MRQFLGLSNKRCPQPRLRNHSVCAETMAARGKRDLRVAHLSNSGKAGISIVSFFTPKMPGKLAAVARRARKAKSSFGAGLGGCLKFGMTYFQNARKTRSWRA